MDLFVGMGDRVAWIRGNTHPPKLINRSSGGHWSGPGGLE
jgi:hypothetical protein